jgi:hypothetical protein
LLVVIICSDSIATVFKVIFLRSLGFFYWLVLSSLLFDSVKEPFDFVVEIGVIDVADATETVEFIITA